jgi:uncharacterized tellurite resistance protein B-like protein
MVNSIRQFFQKYIKPADDTSDNVPEHSLHIATAALLIEMMRADAKISKDERTAITQSMQSKFQLSNEETNTIVQLAEEEIWKSTGYYEFTSLINKGFTYAQKVKVIEHMWEVAFADTELEKHEEHMIRKITDLIFVSHEDFIKTKLRVKKKKNML